MHKPFLFPGFLFPLILSVPAVTSITGLVEWFLQVSALYNATYRLFIGMPGKELLRRFLADGWKSDRIHGSHRIVVKEGMRAVPIPIHGNRDLPKGSARAILKQGRLERNAG